MKTFEWALRSIQEAPPGPRVAAVFDLDGTVVQGFTALRFLKDQLQRGDISASDLVTLAKSVIAYRSDPSSGIDLIREGAELFRGHTLAGLEARAARVFKQQVARSIRPQARELIRAHRRAGHTIALATAATQFQAGPVASDLGIDHVLSTEVTVEDGVLTGRLRGEPRWGAEKARAVEAFAAARDIDLQQSFGYGNGAEDRDFLRAVGRPVAVNPDPGLWPVIDAEQIPVLMLAEPPQPGLRGLLGTLGAIGTFNTGLLLTLLASAVMDRRQAHALGIGRTADATLVAAGVRVRAQGQANIDAGRPGVIIFNHQSNLDPIVVCSLVRRDVTGVGKAEIKSDPRGMLLRLMDITLIDRGNPEEARASITALVDRIHGGESVLIAPEGTRMPSPTLGRFKMGAFHLAMDAKVPLIPIVIRNSGELFPRGTKLIRPGTVDVRVLAPVQTTDWTRENLKDRVAEVRAMFEHTLEHWPSPDNA